MSRALKLSLLVGAVSVAMFGAYHYANYIETPKAIPSLSSRATQDTRSSQDQEPEKGIGSPVMSAHDAFIARTERSALWALPTRNRIAGIASTTLASSPQQWLDRIPPEDRHIAEQFLARNSDSMNFASKAQHAWLMDRGFPALEEVVAYHKLPEPERKCVPSCSSGKLGALRADALLAEYRSLIDEPGSDGLIPESVRERISSLQIEAMAFALPAARSGGSGLFSLHLSEELDRLVGDASSEESAVRRSAASAVARSCGYPRLNAPNKEAEVAATAGIRYVREMMQGVATDFCRPTGEGTNVPWPED